MMRRLGLGLPAARAREKISGGCLFMSSLTANEKSLHLCFYEESRCRDASMPSEVNKVVDQVVRRISLNNDYDDGGEEQYLREDAAFKSSKDIGNWEFCGRFGSQILFPCGPCGLEYPYSYSYSDSYTHMNGVDTSTQPMKFQEFKAFSTPKVNPVLVELNGKLYCIDNHQRYDSSPTFEVLDPEDNFNWRPLDRPPPLCVGLPFSFYCSVLEGSNKILGWGKGKSEVLGGVYCFDVTKPENGWAFLDSDLSKHLPVVGYLRPPVFIQNHHPHLGHFYLMFSYTPYSNPFTLLPYLMSHNCDSFQPIGEEIRLPQELCSQYIPEREGCGYGKHICTDFDIVHLEAQKFCLVLNKFYSFDPNQGLENTGTLLLVTFEYDIIPNVNKVDIQTRFLGARHFRYHPEQLREPNFIRTSCLHLTDAFVL